jgi:hypothetical protein
MASRTDKMSAGNSRAAYMREYRKGGRLEEDNCNNVPKRSKLHAERHTKTYLHNTTSILRVGNMAFQADRLRSLCVRRVAEVTVTVTVPVARKESKT